MSDLSTLTQTQYNILGSSGAHTIHTRAALRNGGANQTIVPGTVMQISEDDARACSPWGGVDEMDPQVVCGVALEGATLTATAQPINILVSGTVNNDAILIHGSIIPTPEDWNQMQLETGIVPQGFEYGTLQ
jgi:hypothetical protein